MSASADRDLLHGLIALQNHFIDQSDLLAAFHSWCEDRSRSLVQVLRDRKALDDDTAKFLEALVAKHLARFGGDAAQSLAALSSIGSAREALAKLPDPAIQASLGHVHRPDEELGTRLPTASDFPAESRFRVLRFHAKGGLGQVSVALDKELGREVAFKEIQEKHADHPDSRTRFKVEAEITGGLEHPGIVPVYSLGHDPTGRPFYAMRFIRGDNLADAIKRFRDADGDPNRDPGERTVALRKLLGRFLDVCNAIAYAHSRGVLHRDLKPGNIMLGDFGETLVVDWGLAKLVDAPELIGETSLRPSSLSGSSATEAGRVVGTPAFMSPEQALGRIDILGPASDVYCLGSTLYALLTGRPPYEGTGDEIVAQVPRGSFPPPRRLDPRIPLALESICLEAMKLDPADRYPTCRALAEDLEHWLADEPVSAHPESLTARLARWTRRHKSATLSAAAALLVISAVSTLAFVVVRKALTAEQVALAAQKKATEAAEHDRARAEVRETMAVEAIKKFEKAVVGNPLLKNDPKLKPLRDTLLKEPLGFSQGLRELLQADGDTRPESLVRLAGACFSLGVTTSHIGDQSDAMKAFKEYISIFERLVHENPAGAEYQHGLANGHNNIGLLRSATGQSELALESHHRALEIRTRLARENPTVTDYQNRLAVSHNYIGNLQSGTGQTDLALKSYGRALEIHLRLVSENPTVAEYQNDLAMSHYNIGNLQSGTGQTDLALKSYGRALEILERLVTENPTVTEHKNQLAKSHFNIGNLRSRAGQTDLALKSYGRALEIHLRLVTENPTVSEYQDDLAGSHNNIGTLQRATGQTDLALKSFGRALEIHERLVGENPTVTMYRNSLAHAHNNIGLLQHATGQTDLAMKSYCLGLEIHERLVGENPSINEYQNDLAMSHNNIGVLWHDTGKSDLALESYGRALKIRQRLVRENPTLTDYRNHLFGSYYNIGILQCKAGRYDLALKLCDDALEISERLARENPTVAGFQQGLASTHYCIACILSLKAAATLDATMAQSHTDRAMDALRRADSAGWTDWKAVSEDDDLKALRGRADFQELIRSKLKPKEAGAK